VLQCVEQSDCSEQKFDKIFSSQVILHIPSKTLLFWVPGSKYIHGTIETQKFKLLLRTNCLKSNFLQIIHSKYSPICPVECCSDAPANWDKTGTISRPRGTMGTFTNMSVFGIDCAHPILSFYPQLFFWVFPSGLQGSLGDHILQCDIPF
jgi:hypothetical protein